MSSKPRLPSAVPGATPEFATVTAHAPELIARFFDLYAYLWQVGGVGNVDPALRELCRLRNARITDCGY